MKPAYVFKVFLVFLGLVVFSVVLGQMTTTDGFDTTTRSPEKFERATVPQEPNVGCPDVLIRRGNQILLYNSQAPGSTPTVFQSLDQYTDYVTKNQEAGIHCPVLFLQQESNAQGNDVYKMYAGTVPGQTLRSVQMATLPPYVEGGLPPLPLEVHDNRRAIRAIDASRENTPWNQGNYPGFDPYGLHIGRVTDIDLIHQSTQTQTALSDNPMDPNWGGVIYTQNAVNSGKYEGEEVRPVIYPNYNAR